MEDHIAIVIPKEANTKQLVKSFLSGSYSELSWLQHTRVGVFSNAELEKYIEEEEIHDKKILSKNTRQSLRSMSSGERKKALLSYLVKQKPEVLVLVNALDNLDINSQTKARDGFQQLSLKISIVQITNRSAEIFPFAKKHYRLINNELINVQKINTLLSPIEKQTPEFNQEIPPPLIDPECKMETLIRFKNISVVFDDKTVLKNINWTIKRNEFWQLVGPNGSGKSTLLHMITGDSHKGYGQDLTLFGHKKGSGESVWDIKALVGYFSPHMVDRFRGYHTLENMLISGLHDSIGLYQIPTEAEKKLSSVWLELIGLKDKQNQYFNSLSTGEKRLLMTVRAMIKHPPLLILDEPTVGLDDESIAFFVALVNKFAQESQGTIIYVSHKQERGLNPNHVFELFPSKNGSTGKIANFNYGQNPN